VALYFLRRDVGAVLELNEVAVHGSPGYPKSNGSQDWRFPGSPGSQAYFWRNRNPYHHYHPYDPDDNHARTAGRVFDGTFGAVFTSHPMKQPFVQDAAVDSTVCPMLF